MPSTLISIWTSLYLLKISNHSSSKVTCPFVINFNSVEELAPDSIAYLHTSFVCFTKKGSPPVNFKYLTLSRLFLTSLKNLLCQPPELSNGLIGSQCFSRFAPSLAFTT